MANSNPAVLDNSASESSQYSNCLTSSIVSLFENLEIIRNAIQIK